MRNTINFVVKEAENNIYNKQMYKQRQRCEPQTTKLKTHFLCVLIYMICDLGCRRVFAVYLRTYASSIKFRFEIELVVLFSGIH